MQRLYTVEGRSLPVIPWEQYPRPQLRRMEWLCLNGEWVFYGAGYPRQKILVPFCPESLLSGIVYIPKPGEEMNYEREFTLPEGWRKNRIVLHFGAVSRRCTVWLNDVEIFRHDEAYLPFSVDITDSVHTGANRLRVSAVNDLDPQYPWGKQKEKRGGMWYTPVSGIWQTVWLEPVPVQYIRSLTIKTGKDWAEIQITGCSEGTILFEDQRIPVTEGKGRIRVESPIFWNPETPHLYPFEVICGEDRIQSYFALRTLEVKNVDGIPRLCLNGKPYFFNGLLDQGYWSDGLYTPAGPSAFEKDILTMKELGYNTLRKHIKIEPEQFYYDCDRLGMIVFQDMVNNGKYHYLRDTVLPTVGFKQRSDVNLHKKSVQRKQFLQSMEATVTLLGNHPCICLWTIFNEGWGQFCADEAYIRLKQMDKSRFVDSTSGWFHQNLSDVDSFHTYFKKLQLGTGKRPQLLSEFGGYSYKCPAHSFNLEKTYGYKKYTNRTEYVNDLKALYKEVVLLAEQGLCGAIYTQVSDVEDETNGLFTFDRKVLKITKEEFHPVLEKLSGQN